MNGFFLRKNVGSHPTYRFLSADLITRECCMGGKVKQLCGFYARQSRGSGGRIAANPGESYKLVSFTETSTSLYLRFLPTCPMRPTNPTRSFELRNVLRFLIFQIAMLPSRRDGPGRCDRWLAPPRPHGASSRAVDRSVGAQRAPVV